MKGTRRRRGHGKREKRSRKTRGQKHKEKLEAARKANATNNAKDDPKGGAKGKGKDKGKNKGDKGAGGVWDNLPAGAKLKTSVGDKSICIKWNQNKDCARDPCNFVHVCYFCEKDNHKGCNHRS